MKNRIFYLITALLLTTSSYVFAQEGFKKVQNSAQFQQKVAEITKSMQTLQCSFEQEKQMSFMEETIASKGAFYFNKDNKLRWEYTEPYEYAIVLKQNKSVIIDNGKKSELNISNETLQEINRMLKSSLQGTVLNEQDKFSYELLENSTHTLVKLTPKIKQMKDYISRMDIYFDKKSQLVSRIDMHEGEDLTTIQLKGCKINQPISEKLFE